MKTELSQQKKLKFAKRLRVVEASQERQQTGMDDSGRGAGDPAGTAPAGAASMAAASPPATSTISTAA